MSKRIKKVFIADESFVFRKGIASIIEKIKIASIIGEAGDPKELVSKIQDCIVDLLIADCKILDCKKPDVLKFIARISPDAKIIVIVDEAQPLFNYIIKNRASVFFSRKATEREFIELITSFLNFHQINNIEPESNIFSPKDIEILNLILQEKTAYEIGDQLNLSHRTVQGRIFNMLRKTGKKTSLGLVMFAVDKGLIHQVNLPNSHSNFTQSFKKDNP